MIEPETKDWTWTIKTPCPQCAYDGSSFRAADTAKAIRSLTLAFPVALAEHAAPRKRPNDHTWAPLESVCHVRDVFRLYEYRLGLMLDLDAPTYPNWDQDETAVSENYLVQDSATVTAELTDAGNSLADRFAAVSGSDWQRTGHRSDNKHFTIETFAVYLVHDPAHHYWDITGHTGPLA